MCEIVNFVGMSIKATKTFEIDLCEVKKNLFKSLTFFSIIEEYTNLLIEAFFLTGIVANFPPATS